MKTYTCDKCGKDVSEKESHSMSLFFDGLWQLTIKEKDLCELCCVKLAAIVTKFYEDSKVPSEKPVEAIKGGVLRGHGAVGVDKGVRGVHPEAPVGESAGDGSTASR